MTLNLFFSIYTFLSLVYYYDYSNRIKSMNGHSLSYIVLYLCLLLPNTFYMVTDLIHLNQFQFNFFAGLNLE
ncbi:DUF1361 domain-containing protein [Staphylococcus aureus]